MHVGEAEAVFAGFDDEGFDFVLEQLAELLARGDGGFGGEGANAGADFEQALGGEGGDNLVRGVRGDARSCLRARTEGKASPGRSVLHGYTTCSETGWPVCRLMAKGSIKVF